MFKTISVPQKDTSNASHLLYSIEKRKPIQIKGLINDWEALNWHLDNLVDRYGNRNIKSLVDLPHLTGILVGGQENHEKIISFAEFARLILDSTAPPCYLAYSKSTDFLNEESNAYDFSKITPKTPYPTDTRLWIGSTNTCSGLHTDLKDNIFAQIMGSKRVFLVPKNESHLVYPFLDNIVNSEVDPELYNLEKFPKFCKATIYETHVYPGDILFIPKGWWHYLRSESPSISINHWFGKPLSAMYYLTLLLRLGPAYVTRTIADMYRYVFLKEEYKKEFFFSPVSTGERLYNLIRFGDFSKENDPTLSLHEDKLKE